MNSVDRQILPGVAILFILIIASALVGYRNIRQLNEDQYWVVHTHVVLDSLDDLLSTIKDAETGQRGFIITGDERYLEPYQKAVATIDPKLQAFDDLTKTNSYQQSH